MSKILVIGIDSLAPALLSEFEADLPNFKRLRELSPEIEIKSIFPVDSIPAWVSIFTGVSPAKHGLLHSFDVFESSWQALDNIDISTIRGRTFWDYAGALGKKVCILFPMLAFPPWDVNGIMVSRALRDRLLLNCPPWMVEREVKTYPPEVTEEYRIPPFIQGLAGRPPGSKGLADFARFTQEVTEKDAQLGLEICQKADWDLFFLMFSWTDILQHLFWRYHDESDPTYPGITPHKDVIRQHYQIMDKIVGEFLVLYADTTVIVISDHGHGMRPPKTVNINELLRKKGFLTSRTKKVNPAPFLLERLKRGVLDFAHRFELDYWLMKIAKAKVFSSWSKDIYMSTSIIDLNQTMAYLSSFAGPKSYPHGGIEINADNLKGIGYQELVSLLIKELVELREPDTGEKLVEWVCCREELYQGPYLSLYPDIVFELKEGYGVYWGVHTPLIGTAYEHNLSSGGHKKDAVFLISGADDVRCLRREASIMDIAPTLLELMGVEGEFDFDGKPMFTRRNK